MERKPVRIISKGSFATDIEVFVGETIMDHITDIKITMLPGCFIEAEIKVLVSELDFEAEANIIEVCPRCNETLEGNDKLSRLKRLDENIINFEENHKGKDFKTYKYFLKEIEG